MPSKCTRFVTHLRRGALPLVLGNAVRKRLGMHPRLARRPGLREENASARRLNALCRRLGHIDTYLEIGVDRGRTLENVEAPVRWGVDPRPRFSTKHLPPGVTFVAEESDTFFNAMESSQRFDLVFLDGLHTYRQTYRDLINSLRYGTDDCVIVIDDVVPIDAISALPDLKSSIRERRRVGLSGSPWSGDVYRLILVLRDHHPELEYVTIVGSGNPQTVVWRKDSAVTSTPVSEDILDAYEAVSFGDVFGAGTPDYFHPLDEATAMEYAVDAVAGGRGNRR